MGDTNLERMSATKEVSVTQLSTTFEAAYWWYSTPFWLDEVITEISLARIYKTRCLVLYGTDDTEANCKWDIRKMVHINGGWNYRSVQHWTNDFVLEIGLHSLESTSADAIVSTVQDILLRLNLRIGNCQGEYPTTVKDHYRRICSWYHHSSHWQQIPTFNMLQKLETFHQCQGSEVVKEAPFMALILAIQIVLKHS